MGRNPQRSPARYYLGFAPRENDRDFPNLRAMLQANLEELERRAATLRDILATDDPECAERELCDNKRVQVTEVLLRPQPGRAAIAAFVDQTFSGDNRSGAA